MTDIVAHIFEDNLVRSIMLNGEPWFVGRDVCHVLDLKNESQALARLDADERAGVCIADPSGTKTAIAISIPGVFRLIFASRKPEAERFKRWLAHDVLPSISKTGKYEARPAADDGELPAYHPIPLDLDTSTARALEIKLAMVNTAFRIFGVERARAVWREQGFTAQPVPHAGGQYEAQECLNAIFTTLHEGKLMWRWLADAMEDDAGAAAVLKRCGIWVEPGRDGFVIANRHAFLAELFEDSAWTGYRWCYVLRRLPGAVREKSRKFEQGYASRGVFIPAVHLDTKEDFDGTGL